MDTLYLDRSSGGLLDRAALQQRLPGVGAPYCLSADELAKLGIEVVAVIPPPVLTDAQAYGEQTLLRDGDRLTLVTAVRDVAPVVPDPKMEILGAIATLEAQQTPRRLREAALTEGGKAWLADLDARIATLRGQLRAVV